MLDCNKREKSKGDVIIGIKYYSTGIILPVVEAFKNGRTVDYEIAGDDKSDIIYDLCKRIGEYEKVKVTMEVIEE
jgi:hypothetical protein